MTPTQPAGAPSLQSIAGASVWNGRLLGASAFGCAGSSVNPKAAILQHDPCAVDDEATAEREVELFKSETTLPARSAVAR